MINGRFVKECYVVCLGNFATTAIKCSRLHRCCTYLGKISFAKPFTSRIINESPFADHEAMHRVSLSHSVIMWYVFCVVRRRDGIVKQSRIKN